MKEIVLIVSRWEKVKGDSQDVDNGYLYYEWFYDLYIPVVSKSLSLFYNLRKHYF